MFRQLSIQLSSKGYILIIIFVDIKDTILCKETAACKIINLIITTCHRNIMLLLRSCFAIEIIIPIKVAIIIILSVIANYGPWSIWIFGLIITSIIKHLQIFVSIICHQFALVSLIELVDKIYMVITCMNEIC